MRAAAAGRLLGVVLLVGRGAPVAAGTLGTLAPATAIPLLRDRLTMQVPAADTRQGRQRGVTAADPSPDVESRIVVDAGDERLVIIVEELVALAPEDLAAAVRRDQPGAPVAPLAARDGGLRVVEAVPAGPPDVGDAVPVLTVFVAQPDRTVQALRFYANRTASRDLDGCRALARSMTRTLTAGTRRLDLEGGARVLGPVAVTLPAGYHLATEKGPDFVVYHLKKLLPLGAAPCEAGVYVGHHARLHTVRTSAAAVTRTEGELLGGPVAWYHWSAAGDDGRSLTEREAVTTLADGTQVHVWLVAGDSGALAELVALAGSLRPAK